MDSRTFEEECIHWRGKILTGKFAHFCYEWDGLPIDETCMEWPCGCYPEEKDGKKTS